ncbi:MAG TPA: enoyl-CoA hydratase/isomerase family protein [Vicinamibacterales bacterium]|nr:enoyl-CoA hydratase/isomerase family protein [Vicinamibacterales bacterium]
MTDQASPVQLALNRDRTRAAFRLFHPKGNIVTAEMIRALTQALDPLAHEAHLKLVTIEGAGGDFSFGASVPEHAPGEIDRILPEAHALIHALLDFPAVTAAIVRGHCLGGGFELALACDFIFAEESALFGLPEIALGVFPPAASALLPMRVGAARATRAILTGQSLPASGWLPAGLIEAVVPDGTIAAVVDRWFDDHLKSRSAAALRHATAAARLSLSQHVRSVLPNLEKLYLADLMATSDAAEGIAAFLEKRPAKWTDR